MKDPTPCSSTASWWRDVPQNRSQLYRGAWRLLLLLLLSPGLVRFYAPLLGLQAAMANVASPSLLVCLLGLSILWCSSLQLGGGLALILIQKLCKEVLPIRQALWQPLIIVKTWGLQRFATLIHRTRRGILRLLRWEACLLLLSVAQWAYCGLASFRHENGKASEKLLWAVLQQVTASILVRCLDKLWMALGWVAQATRYRGLPPLEWARLSGATSKDLDAVTTILPATTVPFSQRFPGPDPATLSRLMPASVIMYLEGGDKDTSKGKGGCGFGATKVPISTRFQIDRTSKTASRSPSKQALAQQVKVTCVLIILLYICAASLFVQILK